MKRILWPTGIRQLCLPVLMAGVLAGCGGPARARSQVQAENHYQLAQSYLGNQTYVLAEQETRKALNIWPEDARYYELLGLIHQAQIPRGSPQHVRFQLAEEAYRTAMQKPGSSPSILVNYSALLLFGGRWEEALKLAQRALQTPGYGNPAAAHTNLGTAYFEQAKFFRSRGTPNEERAALLHAAEQFRKALEYQTNVPEVHHNFGLVYNRLGKHAEAIQEFREAIRLRPSHVEAYVGLGHTLLEEGRNDEARLAFERVIALAPDSQTAGDIREQLKQLPPR